MQLGIMKLISNTLDNEIQDNTIHYNIVKELWKYIESVYFGKDNITELYDLFKTMFCIEVKGKTLSQIYINFNRTHEEWNTFLPITIYISQMCAQREQLSALCFLVQLPLELSIAW